MPRPRQPEEHLDSIVPSPERREELRRIVAEQRRKQGLPPVIQDQATIAKIVDILLGTHAGVEERQRSAAPETVLRAPGESPAAGLPSMTAPDPVRDVASARWPGGSNVFGTAGHCG